MSETPLLHDPSLALRVDEVCLRFEDAWAGGQRPRVEDLVSAAVESIRPALLRELVQLELYYRRRAGEDVTPAEYRARFPELDPDWLAGLVTPSSDASAAATAPPDTPPFPPAGSPSETAGGPSVAGYEVLGVLGRGGMGVVYQARQLKLNRLVALKMILADDHAGLEERARFRGEAEAVAHLQHPHIVQIHEIGEQDGRPYLALEFVEGGSLAQTLAGTPQPAREAAQLVETLARAMHYAHQRGIIHRDLKPANILLQRDQTTDDTDSTDKEEDPTGLLRAHPCHPWSACSPKITDSGLAKRLDGEGSQTQSGALLGTPSYMAPEQAAGQTRQVGPHTDVYALGAILYELLTGRPPFRAATMLDTLEQVRAHDPVSPRQLQPKAPRDLETYYLSPSYLELTVGLRVARTVR